MFLHATTKAVWFRGCVYIRDLNHLECSGGKTSIKQGAGETKGGGDDDGRSPRNLLMILLIDYSLGSVKFP